MRNQIFETSDALEAAIDAGTFKFLAEYAPAQFRCSVCQQLKPLQFNGGTGYARNNARELVCYDCCGVEDRAAMIATGKAVMYLSRDADGISRVGNWCGTLRFIPSYIRAGRHNIARTQTHVWFNGPDGKRWHGVQIGENTEICRCKRLKG